jgi:hypothetical protein
MLSNYTTFNEGEMPKSIRSKRPEFRYKRRANRVLDENTAAHDGVGRSPDVDDFRKFEMSTLEKSMETNQ